MKKEPLFGKNIDELTEITKKTDLPDYAAKQIADWLYSKDIRNIDEMTNLSKKGRSVLKEKYQIGLEDPVKEQTSVDGTKKYLFPAGENKYIETVYIPEEKRNTICLSTQVGCKYGCDFCMTGKQGFQGNLTSGQIVNQIKSLPERDLISNIVLMGMGEPLDNLQEVMKALDLLTSDWGFAMSPRRITLSTVGVLPALKKFLDKSECHLALSLHTPFEEERQKLMPVENKYPFKKIIDQVKKIDWSGQRRFSIEYIVFKGLNDSPKHAKELSRLLHGIKCRVNLIRFHTIPGSKFKEETPEKMEEFQNELKLQGVFTTIRKSRGQDIAAACGLLKVTYSSQLSQEDS
ncbi:MAG: 23S rRNA (adenine(2503)-C(2))-methyltransferase RlmN [Bacteroidetes bacterium]|nr:23S rRNA (adenine(2503)-C(2))-methyltransferase RlmN [Bacteroidota bacterium]